MIPADSSGSTRPLRWDQRRAEQALRRAGGTRPAFGSAQTLAAQLRKASAQARRQAAAQERRTHGATPVRSSFMAGERAEQARELNRRIRSGDLLNETEFYEWAREHTRVNPNYENYLRYVARKRGLGAERGAPMLEARVGQEEAAAQGFTNAIGAGDDIARVHDLMTRAVEAWNARTPGLRNAAGYQGQAALAPGLAQGIPLSPGESGGGFLDFLKEAASVAISPLTYLIDDDAVRETIVDPAERATSEFLTETIPGWVRDALPTGPAGTSVRIGQNTYGLELPQAKAGPPQSAIPLAGLEASTQGILGELGQVPERLLTQPIEGMLYTPAFFYQAATDPVGTAKRIPQAIAEDFRHPLQNPGYLLMDLLSAAGIVRGGARRIGALRSAESAGDVARALLRPVDRGSRTIEPGTDGNPPVLTPDAATILPRRVNDWLPWNTTDRQVGRARARMREVDAELRAADASALLEDVTKAGGRSALTDAEGLAVHAVGAQVTPMELVRMWAARRTGATRERVQANLDRAMRAANDIDQLGILTQDDAGRLIINPGYQRAQPLMARVARRVTGRGRPSLADVAERTRAVSRMDEETKIGLGELDPETARRHIDDVGAFVRGDDIIPGERLRMVTPEGFPGDEAMRPTLETVQLLERDLAKAEARLGRLQAARERMKRPSPQSAARIAEHEQIVTELRGQLGEARQFAPHPERLPEGEFYTYLGEEKPGFVSNFTPKLSGNTLGIPRTPVVAGKHAWTGAALENATFDLSAPRVTARRALAMVRERARLDAYNIAKGEAITATQLLERLEGLPAARRAVEMRHWNAVRVVKGASKADTNALLVRLFRDDSLFASLDLENLKRIARDADAAGQVQLFDNRRVRMNPVRLPREGAVRQIIDGVTQAAKFSILFTKLTGYATPQLVGQAGMSLMGMGLHGSLEFGGKAAAWWRKLTPHERAVIQAGRGAGIVPSMALERGPLPALRRINGVAADLYGVVIDSPFRTASFLYHANIKGYRKLADVKRLLNATEGTPGWQHLREIRDAVDNDFGRFSTLTGPERELARYIFFYPWLRASTLYALRLPANHPVKTTLLIQGGRNAREDTMEGLAQLIERIADEPQARAQQLAEQIMRNNPGLFLTSDTDAAGNPEVIAPQSAAVLQGPHDLYELVNSVVSGQPERLARLGTPGISAAAAVFNYDTFRGESFPEGMSLDERLSDEFAGYVPQLTLARRLRGDQGKTFAYTPWQAWAQLWGGSQMPRGLNIEGAVEVAENQLPKEPAGKRIYRETMATRREHLDAAATAGIPLDNGRLPREIREAFNMRARRKLAYTNAGLYADDNEMTDEEKERKRFEIDMRILLSLKRLDRQQAAQLRTALANAPASAVHSVRTTVFHGLFGLNTLKEFRAALKAINGAVPDLP